MLSVLEADSFIEHVFNGQTNVANDSSTTSQAKNDGLKDRLTRHCRNFIRYLRRTGQARGRISFVVIRASEVKSALIPCFGSDIGLEPRRSIKMHNTFEETG